MTTMDPNRTAPRTMQTVPIARRMALEQAVQLAMKYADRQQTPTNTIVATAEAFETFLTRPEEDPAES